MTRLRDWLAKHLGLPSQEEFDHLVTAGAARDDQDFDAWQGSRTTD